MINVFGFYEEISKKIFYSKTCNSICLHTFIYFTFVLSTFNSLSEVKSFVLYIVYNTFPEEDIQDDAIVMNVFCINFLYYFLCEITIASLVKRLKLNNLVTKKRDIFANGFYIYLQMIKWSYFIKFQLNVLTYNHFCLKY